MRFPGADRPKSFELVHLTKLKHPKNPMLVRDQRIDLAGLISDFLGDLRVEVKAVLQDLMQVQVSLENVLARIEAEIVGVFFDDVLEDVAVRGVADNADVAAFEAQNLFRIALILLAEFRAPESGQ